MVSRCCDQGAIEIPRMKAKATERKRNRDYENESKMSIIHSIK